MIALPNSSRETPPIVDFFPGGGRGSNCPRKSRWGVLCPRLITLYCQSKPKSVDWDAIPLPGVWVFSFFPVPFFIQNKIKLLIAVCGVWT